MDAKTKQYLPVSLIIGALILGGIGFWLLGKSPKGQPDILGQAISPTVSLQITGPKPTGVNTQGSNTFSLNITSPVNNATVKVPYVRVIGKTTPRADIFVNGMEAFADAKGNFSVNTALDEGDNTIFVSANDANGNSAETEVLVNYEISSK